MMVVTCIRELARRQAAEHAVVCTSVSFFHTVERRSCTCMDSATRMLPSCCGHSAGHSAGDRALRSSCASQRKYDFKSQARVKAAGCSDTLLLIPYPAQSPGSSHGGFGWWANPA